MRGILIAATATGLALTSSAFAQTTTTTIITKEPAVAGTIVEIPSGVRTYVTKQEMPSVVLEGPVVVGKALPDTIQYQVIPEYDGYAYAVVNGQRVIIDPATRSVIEVYE